MVVKGLCTDVILGQQFMKRHRNVVFATGGLANGFALGDTVTLVVESLLLKHQLLVCSAIYSLV